MCAKERARRGAEAIVKSKHPRTLCNLVTCTLSFDQTMDLIHEY